MCARTLTCTHFKTIGSLISRPLRQTPQTAVLLSAAGEWPGPHAGFYLHLPGRPGPVAGLHTWNGQRGCWWDGFHSHWWHLHAHGPPRIHHGRHKERRASNDRQQRSAAPGRWEGRSGGESGVIHDDIQRGRGGRRHCWIYNVLC